MTKVTELELNKYYLLCYTFGQYTIFVKALATENKVWAQIITGSELRESQVFCIKNTERISYLLDQAFRGNLMIQVDFLEPNNFYLLSYCNHITNNKWTELVKTGERDGLYIRVQAGAGKSLSRLPWALQPFRHLKKRIHNWEEREAFLLLESEVQIYEILS